jgi:hypothetical protein
MEIHSPKPDQVSFWCWATDGESKAGGDWVMPSWRVFHYTLASGGDDDIWNCSRQIVSVKFVNAAATARTK